MGEVANMRRGWAVRSRRSGEPKGVALRPFLLFGERKSDPWTNMAHLLGGKKGPGKMAPWFSFGSPLKPSQKGVPSVRKQTSPLHGPFGERSPDL